MCCGEVYSGESGRSLTAQRKDAGNNSHTMIRAQPQEILEGRGMPQPFPGFLLSDGWNKASSPYLDKTMDETSLIPRFSLLKILGMRLGWNEVA